MKIIYILWRTLCHLLGNNLVVSLCLKPATCLRFLGPTQHAFLLEGRDSTPVRWDFSLSRGDTLSTALRKHTSFASLFVLVQCKFQTPKPRIRPGGIRCADHATPPIRKSWYYFAKKRRSLGRRGSLADQSHGVFFYFALSYTSLCILSAHLYGSTLHQTLSGRDVTPCSLAEV
jgi:hypothetical protein